MPFNRVLYYYINPTLKSQHFFSFPGRNIRMHRFAAETKIVFGQSSKKTMNTAFFAEKMDCESLRDMI